MENNWLLIGLFLVIAIILPGLPVFISAIISPNKPNALKNSTYECGVETIGSTWVQFKVEYYVFALMFVVFDVESVFLFPWAVAYQQLSFFAVVEGIVFILLLTGALLYVWKKGNLEWV
jgi:NADH:ubiquinone oxidoreductase subunit 3 (subunit A)